MPAVELIVRNKLLAQLAPADLALLTAHCKTAALSRGCVIQDHEALVEQVWFPLSGAVSLLVTQPNGAMIETAIVGREGVINGLVAPGPWRAFSRAVVQLAGTGMSLAINAFQEAAQQSENIRNVCVRYRELLLDQIQRTAACNALHSVESRLARWLLEAHDRVEASAIGLTHEFLAEMLGVRRASVTLAAAKLEGAGLVKKVRGNIVITDRDRLEKAACNCYEALRRHVSETLPERD
jgi:CRP-like cAMP-binding protein